MSARLSVEVWASPSLQSLQLLEKKNEWKNPKLFGFGQWFLCVSLKKLLNFRSDYTGEHTIFWAPMF